jgi:hypothetical protein
VGNYRRVQTCDTGIQVDGIIPTVLDRKKTWKTTTQWCGQNMEKKTDVHFMDDHPQRTGFQSSPLVAHRKNHSSKVSESFEASKNPDQFFINRFLNPLRPPQKSSGISINP